MIDFFVRQIPKKETDIWFLKKHYAHRLPIISYAFGLYSITKELTGVCSFGGQANYMEAQKWKPYRIMELNRLCVNDNLPKNTLSFFVGQCFKLLPKPLVLISYADLGVGHHGYIYQATNWIYTGIGGEGHKSFIFQDGKERHERGVSKMDKSLILKTIKTTPKARYYIFLGNKKEVKDMKRKLRFPILPYPKGDNKRYDSSANLGDIQQILF